MNFSHSNSLKVCLIFISHFYIRLFAALTSLLCAEIFLSTSVFL